MSPILTALLCLLPVAPRLTVQTLEEESTSGSLMELTESHIQVETASGPQQLPIASLQKIAFQKPASTSDQDKNPPAGQELPTYKVELVDGSSLTVTSFAVMSNSATFQLASGSNATVPVNAIRSVRFKDLNQRQESEWQNIKQQNLQSDCIVVRKSGRIDYLEGVLMNVDEDAVTFLLDDEEIPVPLAKLEGMIYHRGGVREQAAPVLQLADFQGSLIEVAEWKPGKDDLRIESPAGLEIVFTYDQIREIDFSSGKITYLSSCEPLVVKWAPYFGNRDTDPQLVALYEPKRDSPLARDHAALDDGKLQLSITEGRLSRIQSYERGMAIHSRCRLIYEIPEGSIRFQAIAGIDARVRQLGHVRLVLSGDGEELLDVNIDGTDNPHEIMINVRGLRKLEILVDYGKDQDIGDHLNLCNARFVK